MGGISQAIAYQYVHEVLDVIAQRFPVCRKY